MNQLKVIKIQPINNSCLILKKGISAFIIVMVKLCISQIPPEWMADGEPIVDLMDRRGEDYKEPPKVVKPFTGSGQRLGRLDCHV